MVQLCLAELCDCMGIVVPSKDDPVENCPIGVTRRVENIAVRANRHVRKSINKNDLRYEDSLLPRGGIEARNVAYITTGCNDVAIRRNRQRGVTMVQLCLAE